MLIELKKVAKSYKDSNFNLKDINIKINKKEVIGIIGQNGSGKSTILKMINGLVKFDSGDILYKGNSLKDMKDEELRNMRKNVSYIFQNFNLLEGESVYYHLSLIYKLNKQKINNKEIDEILEFMNIKHLKNSICKSLSGGQQQKVAIAMSLLQKPEILLCDEISSALDSNSEKEIYDLLIKLKETSDISILIISHNLTVLKNFCDKVILIEDSTIKDTIIPNPSNQMDYKKDYFNHVKEFLLND